VSRGFASIGLVRPKTPENVGSVLRAAHCYGAAMVAIQGDRTPVRSHLDTPKAWRHMPVLRGDDLRAFIPFDAVPVAIDLVDGAVELPNFVHPLRAFYVFGPEDGTLGKATTDWCKHKVMIPTRDCMNLAATVNVVLYDRLAKSAQRSKFQAVTSSEITELAASSLSGGLPMPSSFETFTDGPISAISHGFRSSLPLHEGSGE
jgi:tRNA(Leu) C34 or U34 (ribose-2'-O)-methylase TrmL